MHSRRAIAGFVLLGLLAAGCAPLPFLAPPAPTSTVRALAPLEAVQSTATATLPLATPTAEPSDTATSAPFELQLTPLPTETALPTVVIPTEVRNPPALGVWDGLPTYLAESNPNDYFRVQYDPEAWALTTDNFGMPALVHRTIASCIISPAAGRGLPPNATVEHETRRINGISYDISTTFVNGVRQSVTYVGGDGRIYTAFQVSLEDRADQCLLEAETVLGTLSSVPITQATPIATP